MNNSGPQACSIVHKGVYAPSLIIRAFLTHFCDCLGQFTASNHCDAYQRPQI